MTKHGLEHQHEDIDALYPKAFTPIDVTEPQNSIDERPSFTEALNCLPQHDVDRRKKLESLSRLQKALKLRLHVLETCRDHHRMAYGEIYDYIIECEKERVEKKSKLDEIDHEITRIIAPDAAHSDDPPQMKESTGIFISQRRDTDNLYLSEDGDTTKFSSSSTRRSVNHSEIKPNVIFGEGNETSEEEIDDLLQTIPGQDTSLRQLLSNCDNTEYRDRLIERNSATHTTERVPVGHVASDQNHVACLRAENNHMLKRIENINHQLAKFLGTTLSAPLSDISGQVEYLEQNIQNIYSEVTKMFSILGYHGKAQQNPTTDKSSSSNDGTTLVSEDVSNTMTVNVGKEKSVVVNTQFSQASPGPMNKDSRTLSDSRDPGAEDSPVILLSKIMRATFETLKYDNFMLGVKIRGLQMRLKAERNSFQDQVVRLADGITEDLENKQEQVETANAQIEMLQKQLPKALQSQPNKDQSFAGMESGTDLATAAPRNLENRISEDEFETDILYLIARMKNALSPTLANFGNTADLNVVQSVLEALKVDVDILERNVRKGRE